MTAKTREVTSRIPDFQDEFQAEVDRMFDECFEHLRQEDETLSKMIESLDAKDEPTPLDSTVVEREALVERNLRAGFSTGANKSQFIATFGKCPPGEFERYLRTAKASLQTAIESDADMAKSLEVYRLWVAIANATVAHVRSRERYHQLLQIPPPAEMLGLERDWGKAVPAPEQSIQQIEGLLRQLRTALEGPNAAQ